MSAGHVATPPGTASGVGPASSERLSLGVAARLSRYLQVLTQAKKMGKETISSQAISEYTNVNPTQIRRDLSGFGKFGKRGVGYDIDMLIAQIRKILRTSGQHNIALFGAGNLGQAIATSGVFADHGFASRRSSTSTRTGWPRRWATSWCATTPSCRGGGLREHHGRGARGAVVGRPERGRRPGVRRREDHLQLLRRPAAGAARRHRHTSSPAVELLYALYFYLT